jgi:hypothetical protein
MVSSKRLRGQLCTLLAGSLGANYMSWKRMLARSSAFDASERSIAASMFSCNPKSMPWVVK